MLLRMLKPTSLDTVITDFLNARRAERLSEHTLLSYQNGLNKFLTYLGHDHPVAAIKPADIRGFLAEQEEVSDTTLLKYYTCLSALWTWLVNENIVKDHTIHRVSPPKPEERAIMPYTREHIIAFLHATDRSVPYKRAGQRVCDHATHCGARDRAIIYLLVDTGIRVSELCGLKVRDLQPTSCLVYGKGKKEREVPYSEVTHAFIWAYLDGVPDLHKNTLVFPIQRHAVYDVCERLSARTGIDDVHPHRFRHTFAISFLRNGGNIFVLQRILGHTSLVMVKKYLAIAQSDLDEAHLRSSPVTCWNL
jgi:integrase/recombinase XerD